MKRDWLNRAVPRTTRQELEESLDLTVAYVREETLGPLRGALRWLGVGLVASCAIVIGSVFVVLGILRLVQDLMSSLGSAWSAVPYVFAAASALGWTILVLSRIDKDRLS